MKKDTIRLITIELAKMALYELGQQKTKEPSLDPIFTAIATGITTAIKIQSEELRAFARAFKPDVRALFEGWIIGKELEAGLPPTLPNWYRPDHD